MWKKVEQKIMKNLDFDLLLKSLYSWIEYKKQEITGWENDLINPFLKNEWGAVIYDEESLPALKLISSYFLPNNHEIMRFVYSCLSNCGTGTAIYFGQICHLVCAY